MLDTLIAATGTAELQVPPDRATLTLGVRTEDPHSLRTAARACTPLERAVLDALTRESIPRERIVTLRYDSGRVTWYGNSKQHYGNYYVEHVLAVELHDLERIGALITAARTAGATRIVGLSWWCSEQDRHEEAATRAAVARAFARARVLAEAAGARLGRVVRLGTPEALASTLGATAGGRDGNVYSAVAGAPMLRSDDEDDDGDGEPLILPVPVTFGNA